MNIEKILAEAAATALNQEMPNFADVIHSELNLFESVDSFAIVNLLLETESELERALGRYVALADENIFDAVKSPFLCWEHWVEYVSEQVKK